MSTGLEDFGTPVWTLLLCLLFCWMLVFVVLIKGISSLGKVSSREIEKQFGHKYSLIARFMGPTWGPSGADRVQVGPMLVP